MITVFDHTQLDFETTPTYTLTVQATDNGGLTATTTVTVNLIDLVEYTFLNGTLSVSGTVGDDTLAVRTDSGTIRIDANSDLLSTGLAAGSVKQIEVYGAGGNDVLTIDTSVSPTTRTLLRGDEGDDTLTGGLGNDMLEGGAGHDTVDGRGGNLPGHQSGPRRDGRLGGQLSEPHVDALFTPASGQRHHPNGVEAGRDEVSPWIQGSGIDAEKFGHFVTDGHRTSSTLDRLP